MSLLPYSTCILYTHFLPWRFIMETRVYFWSVPYCYGGIVDLAVSTRDVRCVRLTGTTAKKARGLHFFHESTLSAVHSQSPDPFGGTLWPYTQ